MEGIKVAWHMTRMPNFIRLKVQGEATPLISVGLLSPNEIDQFCAEWTAAFKEHAAKKALEIDRNAISCHPAKLP